MTDEDSPRVTYDDRAQDGTILPIADQEEAPSHSGVVSFDFSSYKIADTVTVTLQDALRLYSISNADTLVHRNKIMKIVL